MRAVQNIPCWFTLALLDNFRPAVVGGRQCGGIICHFVMAMNFSVVIGLIAHSSRPTLGITDIRGHVPSLFRHLTARGGSA